MCGSVHACVHMCTNACVRACVLESLVLLGVHAPACATTTHLPQKQVCTHSHTRALVHTHATHRAQTHVCAGNGGVCAGLAAEDQSRAPGGGSRAQEDKHNAGPRSARLLLDPLAATDLIAAN